MDPSDNADDLALVFLYLESCKQYHVVRSSPQWDPGCLDRLYEQGYLCVPGLGERVMVTEEGKAHAARLFADFFGKLQF